MDRSDEAPDTDVDCDVDVGIILDLEGSLKCGPLEVGYSLLCKLDPVHFLLLQHCFLLSDVLQKSESLPKSKRPWMSFNDNLNQSCRRTLLLVHTVHIAHGLSPCTMRMD